MPPAWASARQAAAHLCTQQQCVCGPRLPGQGLCQVRRSLRQVPAAKARLCSGRAAPSQLRDGESMIAAAAESHLQCSKRQSQPLQAEGWQPASRAVQPSMASWKIPAAPQGQQALGQALPGCLLGASPSAKAASAAAIAACQLSSLAASLDTFAGGPARLRSLCSSSRAWGRSPFRQQACASEQRHLEALSVELPGGRAPQPEGTACPSQPPAARQHCAPPHTACTG